MHLHHYYDRLKGQQESRKHLQDCMHNEGGGGKKPKLTHQRLKSFVVQHQHMEMPTTHVSTLQMLLCSTAPGSLSGISGLMVSLFCSERCWLVVKSRTQISRNNKFSNGNPAASSLAAAKESLTGNLVSLYLIQATCAAVSNLSTQIFKPLLADQFVPYSNAYCSNSHWHQPEKHWTITGWLVAEPTNKVLMIWGEISVCLGYWQFYKAECVALSPVETGRFSPPGIKNKGLTWPATPTLESVFTSTTKELDHSTKLQLLCSSPNIQGF